MVEFALILPIVRLLLLGIVEFGRAYNQQVALQAAAREGARELALRHPDQVVPAVLDAAPSVPLNSDDVSILQSCPTTGDGRARVQVSQPFHFFGFLNLGPITLSATAEMRCGL